MGWLRNHCRQPFAAVLIAAILAAQGFASAAGSADRLTLRLLALDTILICHGQGGSSPGLPIDRGGLPDCCWCQCILHPLVSIGAQHSYPQPPSAVASVVSTPWRSKIILRSILSDGALRARAPPARLPNPES
jgi:hypothetical protein